MLCRREHHIDTSVIELIEEVFIMSELYLTPESNSVLRITA